MAARSHSTRNDAAKPAHPTKLRLLDTAVALLDEHAAQEITVEMVLSASGVSLGSLYHHYRDMGDLLDAALVFRFGRSVDRSIEWIHEALDTATSRAEFFEGLRRVTRGTQSRDLRPVRAERAGALHRASGSPEFRERLGAVQQRLTDSLTGMIASAQAKGWVTPDVDPRAGAVLLQAYSIGRSVDDITSSPMDDEAWIALIDRLAERVFGVDL